MSKRRKQKHRDLRIQRRTQPGASPGTVVADPAQPQPEVSVFAYSADKFHTEPLTGELLLKSLDCDGGEIAAGDLVDTRCKPTFDVEARACADISH